MPLILSIFTLIIWQSIQVFIEAMNLKIRYDQVSGRQYKNFLALMNLLYTNYYSWVSDLRSSEQKRTKCVRLAINVSTTALVTFKKFLKKKCLQEHEHFSKTFSYQLAFIILEPFLDSYKTYQQLKQNIWCNYFLLSTLAVKF